MTSPDAGSARLRLRCMGTRGSIASPGPDTLRYGGNTPCVEVMAGGRRLILDAGTGIRALGAELAAGGAPVEATIFLTHFHWDHVQGLPFFAPAYDPASAIDVVGPVQRGPDGEEVGVERLVAGLLGSGPNGSSYFPIPMTEMSGVRTFGHLNEGTWERDGVSVRAMRVRHPAFTVGYRVTVGGTSIAFVPDNEILAEAWPLSRDWRARFVGFLAGVDVLVHDAMYTEAEYEAHAGHGHSTYRQAMDVAHEAGVGELLFFHHDPTRSDEALDDLVEHARNDALAQGRTFGIRAAREGEVLEVGVGASGHGTERGAEVADDG